MAEEKRHRHIILDGYADTENYIYPGGGGSEKPLPERNRASHAERLLASLDKVLAEAREREEIPKAVALPAKKGLNVVFESEPGFDLELKSMEDRRQGIQLVAVRESPEAEGVTQATVYVPEGKLGVFERKIRKYAVEDTDAGRPWHQKLVEKISDIRLAQLREFWTDRAALLPAKQEEIWWEVWLRTNDEHAWHSFHDSVEQLGIEVGERTLTFPSTRVLLAYGTLEQFAISVEVVDAIAELRRAKELPSFFMSLPRGEQRQLVEDLLDRIEPPGPDAPSICVLDTGVNAGHPLLVVAAEPDDLHAVDPTWGADDHHPGGHGTGVAGLALYGDLTEVLTGSQRLQMAARLESVKILPPPPDSNDPELYGRITEQAVYRVEVERPTRRRVHEMAVTTEDGRERGKPTSWSAAVDKLAYGEEGNPLREDSGQGRLFILAAGNSDPQARRNHPDHLATAEIHDPGQAWNALTVGSFTERWRIEEEDYAGWEPVARPGDLSPSTSTSSVWQPPWPLKPDVVAEGGNAARSPDGQLLDTPDSLSLLTTHHQPLVRSFTPFRDTSAASPLVARMAAILQGRYPAFWPETIRALIVHSAAWTPTMLERYQPSAKREYAGLVRECGFGVPSLERALWSADNRLTLIAQDSLQPFAKEDKRSYATLKEFQVYELPWPIAQLRDLEEVDVELRVTLSYFIEPNPSERGYQHRHRYQSHGFRFDVRAADETLDEFRKRLSKAAREEEEESPRTSDPSGWVVGSDARHRGSLHSDIWRGPAADLANRQHLAVYPVTGWWKERHHLNRWQREARYALVVSIHAPEIEVDLYTPVLTAVGIAAEIPGL